MRQTPTCKGYNLRSLACKSTPIVTAARRGTTRPKAAAAHPTLDDLRYVHQDLKAKNTSPTEASALQGIDPAIDARQGRTETETVPQQGVTHETLSLYHHCNDQKTACQFHAAFQGHEPRTLHHANGDHATNGSGITTTGPRFQVSADYNNH